MGLLIRELITRFGFDVDKGALNQFENHIGQISLGLAAMGGTLLALPTAMVIATGESQRALGALTSVGVKDLNALEEGARKFTNQWAGITKPALIDGAYEIKGALSNLSDEAVAQFTQTAALTGIATKASLADMTMAFTKGYAIFKGLAPEMSDQGWAEQFAGGLATAVQIFHTEGTFMAQAMKDLGAAASTAKIPMEEQLAILAKLQDVKPGTEAGTFYKVFMNQAAKAGQKLGLDFVDKGTGRLKRLSGIVSEIRKKFPDLSKAAAQVKLKEAFGSDEAVGLITLLAPHMEELSKQIEQVGAGARAGTRDVVTMAEAMQRGRGLELLSQRWQNLREELGKPLLPMFNDTTDALGRFMMQLQQLAHDNPQATKSLGQFSYMLGGLLTTLGLIGGIARWVFPVFRAGLAALGIGVAGGISGFLGIAAAVLAAVAALTLFVDDFYNWVKGNKSALGRVLGDWENFSASLIRINTGNFEDFKKIWEGLPEFFSGLVKRAMDALSGISLPEVSGIPALWRAAKGAGESVADTWSNFTGAPSSTNVAPVINTTVNVPPGTTAQDAQGIAAAVKASVGDILSRTMREAAGAFPRTE